MAAGGGWDACQARAPGLRKAIERAAIAMAASFMMYLAADIVDFNSTCVQGKRRCEDERRLSRWRNKFRVLVAVRKCFLLSYEEVTENSNRGTVAIRKE